ncbi:serine/threonine-protein kinase [Actinomycetospora sp. C-140]
MAEPPGPGEAFGHYRLLRRLGRGGMGEVHRAHDTRRDREVALKRLAADLADDPGIRERFDRECRTAARLFSPHVIPIHDFGVIDGRLYLDMRLVEGRDLARLLREDGPLEPARAVGIVEQVADALDDAHAHDLVHRDVKPANVLVTSGRGPDFVQLVDFGIVRLAEGTALTDAGTVLGTFTYMAPEQFDGAATIDRRADVYALAVVLHELLVGRPPFGGDLPSLMHQHLTAVPERPSRCRPGLPPVLDAVVARGMAKVPGDRYARAGDLAEAARAALADGVAATDPAGPATPGPAPRRERFSETWVGPVDRVGHAVPPPTRRSAPHPGGGPPVGGSVRWDSAAPTPGSPNAPEGPGAPAPRRRVRVAGVVAAALVLVAVTLVTLLVVLAPPDDTPDTIALGPPVSLTRAFPDSAGDGCVAGDNAAYVLPTGAAPESAVGCVRGATAVAYLRYPSPSDGQERVAASRATPSTDGFATWSADDVEQGPYHQTLAAGQCTAVLAYTGLPYVVQISAPADRCADVDATFATVTFPRNEELRSPARAIPGAAGCGDGTPTPGTARAAPRQVRQCGGPEGTTVAWSRWGSADQVVAEVNARSTRAGGGATSWNAPGGPRVGPAVQDERDGQCRTLLGYDAAAYAAEVVGTDCDVVDRAVAALAPPPADSLPA